MSQEIGFSRMYGGIHIRYAVEEGFNQGRKVARNIESKMKFKKISNCFIRFKSS